MKRRLPSLATTNGKEPLVQRQFCLLGGEEFSAPQKGKCAPTLYIECVFVSHSLTILFAEAFICFYICYEFERYTLTIILILASLNTIHTNNTGYRTPAEIVTQKSSFFWYGKIIFSKGRKWMPISSRKVMTTKRQAMTQYNSAGEAQFQRQMRADFIYRMCFCFSFIDDLICWSVYLFLHMLRV